ncbi:MAG: hypothetical protein LBV59_18325 [Sphingobacterium sp.]|jgi:hypothetical protein|uniref:hypothetical protein n=1 Tax=Sphingobacterium sp. TaxID=341027 RepID=UPI002843E708|nr:hypothetical protein [Sphingobacterium sp.]MDR3009898.1 hypothetical protein [Sphingobacterium sp.]
MKKITFLLPIIGFILFLACSKDNSKSYEYWNEQVNAKAKELTTLLQSVPCTNIEEFEIIQHPYYTYYLVHSSLKNQFEKLKEELDYLESERNKAAEHEGKLFNDAQRLSMPIPNPPVGKVCYNGKAALRFAYELSLDETNAELPKRYKELKEFYKDVTCSNPNDWTSHFLRSGCCMEGIAVHKTIRSTDMIEKIELYNRLMENKLRLEKTKCEGGCPNMARPVQCKDGKPFVEVYKS